MACEPWESDVGGVKMSLMAGEALIDSIDGWHYPIELGRVAHNRELK